MDNPTRRSLAENIVTGIGVFHQKVAHKVPFSIPANHFFTLIVLHDFGTQTISKVSEKLLISKQQMSPIIDKLCKNGLVKREQDPLDRRNSNITILPEGIAILENHHKKMVDLLDKNLAALENDEVEVFQKSLCTCSKFFHTIL